MSGCEGVGVCGGSLGGGVASSTFAAAIQFLLHSQCLITEPWPAQASLPNGTSVDVIIVGGGTGGSTLAARLAETNLTVLLLEAGGDPPVESIIPGFRTSLYRSNYECDWNFTSVDDHYSSQELENHQQRLHAGHVLGGGSSINGMIYARGVPSDYDEWADTLGDSCWNFNNVLPYFKKTEQMTVDAILNYPPSQKYHGYDGEIAVSSSNEDDFAINKLFESFKELGFNIIEDQNNPESIGASHMSFNIKDGKRQSSVTAMLNKVAHKENIYIMKNTFTTKILIKNNAAYGVKVLVGNDEMQFYANKEVIISAGAFNTPKLLMLSGIGPKEHLVENGIDVVKESPVGRNLQNHIFIFKFIAADIGSCPVDKKYIYGETIKYLFNQTGSLSISNHIAVEYALKHSLTPQAPDFAFYPSCYPKGYNFMEFCLQRLDFTLRLCTYLHSVNKKHELFSFQIALLKPKSRGRVTLASANPKDKPLISSGTFSNIEDLEGYPEAFDVIRSLVNTTYFKSKNAFIVDLNLESCNDLEWPEDEKCEALGTAMAHSHGVGTAAMGSVLDSRLRVRGMRKLRVVDASVMPTIPRGNTNAIVVMIAEKAADFIKEEYDLI